MKIFSMIRETPCVLHTIPVLFPFIQPLPVIIDVLFPLLVFTVFVKVKKSPEPVK